MGEYGATGALSVATLVLVVEFALAASLVVGMFLVRRGYVRWHARIQATVVLGNIPIVGLWMLPAYWGSVLPGLPARLGEPFYLFPTLMLAAGVALESLGVYVIMVAGTNLIPERWRFRRYKLVMRTLLGLWWIVLLTGISTYYFWFYAAS
jgi:uncharacterized membrane protein YozB (DUF420 family)